MALALFILILNSGCFSLSENSCWPFKTAQSILCVLNVISLWCIQGTFLAVHSFSVSGLDISHLFGFLTQCFILFIYFCFYLKIFHSLKMEVIHLSHQTTQTSILKFGTRFHKLNFLWGIFMLWMLILLAVYLSIRFLPCFGILFCRLILCGRLLFCFSSFCFLLCLPILGQWFCGSFCPAAQDSLP